MLLLRRVATGSTWNIVPAIGAVLVPTIAWATEIKRAPTPVIDTLDQP
jgi:hypothetical protein